MLKFRLKKNFKEDIEPHEILLDSLAKKKEEELGLSEKKFEVALQKIILQGFYIFCFLIILLLFGKTFQLQIIEGKNFSVLAQKNKFTIQQIRAERGVIYDRNLTQLVFNQPRFDLILNINDLPKKDDEKNKVLKEVSTVLKKDIENLKKEIENSTENILVVSGNLSHQQLILLESRINELPGFGINDNTTRLYEDGEIFAHLIGYTGKIKTEELRREPEFYTISDYVGRAGIEKSYENTLRRNPGKLQIEKDVKGDVVSKKNIQFPESGKSLVLWLDANLQKKIKEELETELQLIGAQKGAAVAINPKTGGILSLISLPAFDNNLFCKGADSESLEKLLADPQKLEPFFNRAISGGYLTGSIIKPLIASAALEENIISPEKKLDCEGKIVIPNPWDPSSPPTIKKDWTTHGWTDLKKALAESCNVYFYTVGGGFGNQNGLGPTKIKKYLELFGWDNKTGIDLPGEAEGFVPDKEWKKTYFQRKEDQVWQDGDTYNLSIGQGFLKITPLAVANAFSAIANGGTLYQPQTVQKIVDTSAGSTKIVEEFKPKIIRENFIDPQNLQIVREGMRQAVTGVNSPQASAMTLSSLPVTVAAKTGTAELGNDRYNNWITVFAPYENPEIVLTVMIENIKGVKTAALPVAKAVLEWYFVQEHNF